METKKMFLDFLTVKWNGFLTLSLLLLFFGMNSVSGQVAGDYKSISATSGAANWNTLSIWNFYNGTAWVGASTPPPNSPTSKISIYITHNVQVGVNLNFSNVNINIGVGGVIDGKGIALTFGNLTDLVFSGAVVSQLVTSGGGGTISFSAGVNSTYNANNAQTVYPTTYNNLTLSGSGSKTMTTTTTVNGTLSMEGTATSTGAPTYGASSTLQYKKATSGNEFLSTLATASAPDNLVIDVANFSFDSSRTLRTGIGITNSLTLVSGVFNNTTNNLTMSPGSTVIQAGGSLSAPLDNESSLNSNYAANSISTITGSKTFNDVTVGTGATLTMAANSTLNISGTLTNNGTIDATTNANTIAYTGAVEQTISGISAYNNLTLSGVGQKTFGAGTSTVSVSGNFTVSGGGVIAPAMFKFNGLNQNISGIAPFNNIEFSNTGVGGTKTFTSNGTLGPDSKISFSGSFTGVIDFDGPEASDFKFILKSNASKSATVCPVPTGWLLKGKVTVERDLTNSRSWRLLTAPLITDTDNIIADSEFIFNNWQNTGINSGIVMWKTATTSDFATSGMLPSGTTTGVSNIRKYNISTGNYQSVTNTKSSEKLFTSDTNNCFLVLSTNKFTSNDIVNTSISPLLLEPRGKLRVGPVQYTMPSGAYRLIGNPYASTINLASLEASNPGFKFWFIDTKLQEFGAYVSFSSGTFSAPKSGGGEHDPTSLILSGQAFFVQAPTTGTTHTFTFNEENKASADSNYSMNRSQSSPATLRVTLYKPINNQNKLLDGSVSVFDSNFSNDITDIDAIKYSNPGESLMFRNSNTSLSIDKRAIPLLNEELPMRLTNTISNTIYQLNVYTEQYQNMTVQPYLLDTQTQQQTLVPIDGTSLIYPFTGISATSTVPDDRFKIIFQNSTLSNPNLNTELLSMYPNPAKNGLVYFNLNNGSENLSYSISNLSGQQLVVNSQAMQNNAGEYKIDLSKFPSGVYFIQVKDTNRNWISKILIP